MGEARASSAGEASSNGRAASARVDARARPTRTPAQDIKPAKKPKREGPSKNRMSAIASAERAVEDAESAMRALEDELADPAAWATPYESAKSQARHTAARRAVEAAFAELEALSE